MELINQDYDGINQKIRTSYKNNKLLKKIKKQLFSNSKNQSLIIQKFIPALIKDTKDENAHKIIIAKQKKLEKKKLYKQQKINDQNIQIINEEDEDQEELKQNKQENQLANNYLKQQKNNTKLKNVFFPPQEEKILVEYNDQNNTSYYEIDNQIPHNTEFLTSSTINQNQFQTSSEYIQKTQSNTKSSTQLQQLIEQGQPQSLKFTKLFKPQSQFQEFKQLRDGKKLENVDLSSIKAESIANSTEYRIAQEKAQNEGLYDLNIIMKTKVYRNDNLLKIVQYQNPKLDTARTDNYIIEATSKHSNIIIKQEYIHVFNQNIQQAMQTTEEDAQIIQIVYNYALWKTILEGYDENNKIIQIAKLYKEGDDQNSHFKKLATILHRYIRKICRKATQNS